MGNKILHVGGTGKLSELDYRVVGIRLSEDYTDGGVPVYAEDYGFASITAVVPLTSKLPVWYVAASSVEGRIHVYGIGAKGTDAAATVTISPNGLNNDLVVTALRANEAGNLISVEMLDPGAVSAALSATLVDSYRIIVSLATDSNGDITSTAAEVTTVIHALSDCPVNIENDGADDGSGVVEALAQTFLTGGGSTGVPTETAAASVIHEGVQLDFLILGVKA